MIELSLTYFGITEILGRATTVWERPLRFPPAARQTALIDHEATDNSRQR